MHGCRFLLLAIVQLACIYADYGSAATAPRNIPTCRVQPGDRDFPSRAQWDKLNEQVGGRLVPVVPSAKFCHDLPAGNCTDAQWESATFRSTIPGSMDSNNWEQDYLSTPPSLCLRNGTECGQGNVPVYAINASSAADIQAGVKFAAKHNLKVAIKASGHDFLGRSTAKGALLLWTHYLRDVSFTDSFRVGDRDEGPAVTIGSGIFLNELYTLTKAQDRMVVAGSAATVVAAGGYIQGAGHSAFSPVFGLAADNALEFKIVTAKGDFVTANAVSHPDLFWALCGGGPGSWGVVVSATLRTYPTFSATVHGADVYVPDNEAAGAMAALHARHMSDWGDVGQYFYATNLDLLPLQLGAPGFGGVLFTISTYFPNTTEEAAKEAMRPLLDDARQNNFTVLSENTTTGLANDLVFSPDDQDASNINAILGSRLIPENVYRSNPDGVGQAYTKLLDAGAVQIPGIIVAGGKVSENKNIDSAIHPKWRTAKGHIVAALGWTDDASVTEVERVKDQMTNVLVPILADLTGETDSGAYSNEADVREPNFQVTFFGSKYQRLLEIKRKYDPHDLFIIPAGVGSEYWDEYGICRLK